MKQIHFKLALALIALFGLTQFIWAKPTPPAGVAVEKFDSLLRDPRFKATKALVAQTDQRATFIREIVSMQWRPLDPVTFFVIRPKNVRKPRVVLFCYTFPQSTNRFYDDDFCARITANGTAAIGFESALTGDRYRNRPMKEWFVSELRESLVSSVRDVQYLLDYAGQRPDLSADKVGFFGTGSGGSIGILAASVVPQIKALDLIDPWGDWPNWVKSTTQIPDDQRKAYSQPKFLKAVASIDPFRAIQNLRIPIRIQSVSDEPTVPRSTIKTLEKRLPAGAKLIKYPDNVDFFRASQNGRLFEWVAETIKR